MKHLLVLALVLLVLVTFYVACSSVKMNWCEDRGGYKKQDGNLMYCSDGTVYMLGGGE